MKKVIAGKLTIEQMSRRQRHITLNKAIGYHPTNPVFTYINVNNTDVVVKYKALFLKMVYDKHPYDPLALTSLLVLITKEMEGVTNAMLDVPIYGE